MERIVKEGLKKDHGWYFNSFFIFACFLVFYPFVLPLVWLNPRYSSSKKVFLTFIILVVSAVALKSAIYFLNTSAAL